MPAGPVTAAMVGSSLLPSGAPPLPPPRPRGEFRARRLAGRYSRDMPEIHAARRAAAQAQLAELEADAVLGTAPANVRYLTGLASSNAALLLPADGTGLLATDSRYQLAAQRCAPDLELTLARVIEAG